MSAHKRVTFAASYRSIALSFIPQEPREDRRNYLYSQLNLQRTSHNNQPQIVTSGVGSSALLSSSVCWKGVGGMVGWRGGKASDWSNCISAEWIRRQ